MIINNKVEIFEKEFLDFEKIKKSCVVNMWNIRKIEKLSIYLDKKKIIYIMNNYTQLKKLYKKTGEFKK